VREALRPPVTSILSVVLFLPPTLSPPKLQAKLSEAEGELEAERASQTENQRHVEQYEKQFKAVQKEAAKLQKVLDKVRTEASEFEKQELAIKADVKHNTTALKKETAKLSKASKTIAENEHTLKTATEDCND